MHSPEPECVGPYSSACLAPTCPSCLVATCSSGELCMIWMHRLQLLKNTLHEQKSHADLIIAGEKRVEGGVMIDWRRGKQKKIGWESSSWSCLCGPVIWKSKKFSSAGTFHYTSAAPTAHLHAFHTHSTIPLPGCISPNAPFREIDLLKNNALSSCPWLWQLCKPFKCLSCSGGRNPLLNTWTKRVP